jgi:hypothetical protein
MLRRYIRSSLFGAWVTGVFGLLLAWYVCCLGFTYFPPLSQRDVFWPALAFRFLLPGFLGAIAFFCLRWAILTTLVPARHSVIASLAQHGPPDAVLAAIEAELADVDHVRVLSLGKPTKNLFRHLRRGDLLLTASWLVCQGGNERSLCLVPLPLVAAAERQYGLPDGAISLHPGPEPFHGVLVRLLDGRAIRVPTQPALADRLLIEIRLRVAGALAFEEKWNATRPRLAQDAERITGAPNQVTE